MNTRISDRFSDDDFFFLTVFTNVGLFGITMKTLLLFCLFVCFSIGLCIFLECLKRSFKSIENFVILVASFEESENSNDIVLPVLPFSLAVAQGVFASHRNGAL